MQTKEEQERRWRQVKAGVDMKNYMDDSYLVVGDTIITYSGQALIEKIPERFLDFSASKIGNSAFEERDKLRYVFIPSHIKKIGDYAFRFCSSLAGVSFSGNKTELGKEVFNWCKSLRDVVIADYELTESEYSSFKDASVYCYKGIYVLRELPKDDFVRDLVASVGVLPPAEPIPDGVSMLFHDDESEKFSFEKKIPFLGSSEPVFENDVFSKRISIADTVAYDEKAEKVNDQYVRTGKVLHVCKTAVFTFDDTKTRKENGKVLIEATVKIGCFFWQSSQPVIYDNKKYYVYRRYYLGVEKAVGYVRRDIAVYTDKGLVRNREEAQAVYAKYKLLSIL